MSFLHPDLRNVEVIHSENRHIVQVVGIMLQTGKKRIGERGEYGGIAHHFINNIVFVACQIKKKKGIVGMQSIRNIQGKP